MSPRRAAALRLGALALACLVAFALVVLVLREDPDAIRRSVDGTGAWAPAAFVALGALLTLAFFPFPVYAAAGGLLFGVAGGTALGTAAGWLGALGAFAIARRFGAAPVTALAPRWLLDRIAAIEGRDFEAVLLLRVIPGVPRDLANYLCGLAPIGFVAYALATLLGIAPRALLYAALGEAASLFALDSPAAIVALVLYVVLAVAGLALLRFRPLGPGTARSSPAGRSEGPP